MRNAVEIMIARSWFKFLCGSDRITLKEGIQKLFCYLIQFPLKLNFRVNSGSFQFENYLGQFIQNDRSESSREN